MYTIMPQRNPKSTKRGPGRKHSQGATDKVRVVRPAGVHFSQFGRGLKNQFQRRNLVRFNARRAAHSTASHAKRAA